MNHVAVGFDRALRLEWFDYAGALVANGATVDEARKAMLVQFADEFAGPEALAKAVLVLQRIWFPEDPAHRTLRDRAFAITPDLNSSDRLAVYWALTMATYCFFYNCADHIGRLLRLQPEFRGTQLQRRIIDDWGDRQIISRARQHVLQTLIWWGILEQPQHGVYRSGERASVLDVRAERCLLEGLFLGSSASQFTLDDALRSPALFPFDFQHDIATISNDERFAHTTMAGARRVLSIAR